jgi:2-oxoisovalerate dehydrogenase E2 component (dihydrolipoyl transacylase)
MFHFFDDVRMDALIALRASLKGDATLRGAKLTFLPFVIKALAVAMLKHPAVNACLSPGGDELVQHATANVGVAMATSGGLVVPNIKQVESLGFFLV